MKDNEKLQPTKSTDFPVETPSSPSSSSSSSSKSTSGGVALRRSSRRQSRVNYSAKIDMPARVKSEENKKEEADDDKVAEEVETVPIGSKIRRRFMAGSKAKWFKGKVSSYNEKTGFYLVVYEDGDSEECKIEEVKTILVTAAGSSEQSTNTPAAAAPTIVKSEPKESKKGANFNKNRDDDEDDDGEVEVEDVTEECLEKERAKKKDAQNQAEVLSSDSSSDEATNTGESDYDDESEGDDDDEEDESDAWVEAENEDEESIDDESYMEGDIINNKQKIRRPKGAKDPPLQVIMEEKDMPSAPGKPNGDQDDHDNTADTAGELELEENSTLVQGARRRKTDQAIKDRIIKLLNTGFHEQSNENEAKNAMKLAQRLMRKHNLSQAILLQERQEKNKQQQSSGGCGPEILKGGIVLVRILNRKTNKPAVYARWIASLAHPICKNFDVRSYYNVSRGRKTNVAFYGIYTNCQLAAYAFKVATERISQMMANYKPEAVAGHTTFSPYSEKNISTKSSRLSYAVGVVEGIDRDVERNIQFEKERQERELEKKRLAAFRGEAYEESDDDDYDDEDKEYASSFSIPYDHQAKSKRTAAAFDPNVTSTSNDDGDDVLERSNVETLFDHVDDPSLPSQERVKRDLAKKVIHIAMDDGKKWIQEQKDYWKEKLPKEEFKGLWKDAKGYAFDVWNASQRGGFPKSKAELEDIRRQRRLKEIEKEKQAAIVLVDHREKIADQVLEDQGIKLSKGRKRARISIDRRSYDKGIVDSKEIDINQRAIRDEIKIKKEAKRLRR